tara:strand:- start:508 stop:699 length:192 start_codon:yes stop_codon:yes gene_type:complete
MFKWFVARLLDICLLVGVMYYIQKFHGSGIAMNIEDEGNLFFVISLSFASFFAGMGQARMDNR